MGFFFFFLLSLPNMLHVLFLCIGMVLKKKIASEMKNSFSLHIESTSTAFAELG